MFNTKYIFKFPDKAMAAKSLVLTLSLALAFAFISCNAYFVTVAQKGVSLDKKVVAIVVGGHEQLIASVWHTKATNRNVTWSSSNNAVVTVDNNGYVTGEVPGTAIITTMQDGGYRAICRVTVVSGSTSWYDSTVSTFTLTNADQLADLAALVKTATVFQTKPFCSATT